MIAKYYAIVAGLVLLATGIGGLLTGGRLLIFEVDAVHSVFLLVWSAILLSAGSSSIKAARLWDRIFGVVFGLVAILGFALAGDLVITRMNMADNWGHALTAVTALAAGFWPVDREEIVRDQREHERARARRAA